MKILIKPIDNLFFRNSRPFVRGEDRWADSLLLPNYSTIYGALRTAYLSENPTELPNMGDKSKDKTRNLTIREVGYYIGKKIYVPAPADLVLDKEKEERKTAVQKTRNLFSPLYLEPKNDGDSANSFQSHWNEQMLYSAPSGKYVLPLEYAVISKEQLISAYACHQLNINLLSLARCVEINHKTGIMLDSLNHAVGDKMIYQIGQVAYKGLELYVDFSFEDPNITISPKGLLKLGGHGNVTAYRSYNPDDSMSSVMLQKEQRCSTRFIKVVLKAPAIFKKGWIPDFLTVSSDNEIEGSINIDGQVLKVRLSASIVNGHQLVGGYDLKNKCEKPMYRAVSAGSVYLLKLEKEIPLSRQAQEIRLDSILSNEGFGGAFVVDGTFS